MTVRRAKNYKLYTIGFILIFIGCIIFFLLQKPTLIESLETITLGVTGFLAAARAFYLDRYFRLLDKKEPIDFWLFYNENSIEKIMSLYFIIKPVSPLRSEKNHDVIIKRINTYTYWVYFTFVSTLIIMFYNN